MNKWLLGVAMWLCCLMAYAQSPQAMNFQAVARNAGGNPLSEKEVGIKMEILQGSATGVVVYGETHQATTAKNGVVNLQLGNGTVFSGTFAGIDWSQSPYFLRVSMDTKGGTDYKEMSTSQMLSVPYALYAERAGSTVNEGTAEKKHDFVLLTPMSVDADLVTGENPDMDHEHRYHISYLDGEDQEVTCEIIGLPSGATWQDKDEKGSNPLGTFFYVQLNTDQAAPGYYRCSIVFKNKYGVTKSYPFMCTVSRNQTGNTVWKTDRDVLATLRLFWKPYSSFLTIREENTRLDKVFMKKDNPYEWEKEGNVDEEMKALYDKTYKEFNGSYFLFRHNFIDDYNELINTLSETTEEGISIEVKEQTLKQVRAMRAYTYLMMTEWYGAIPFTLDPNNKFGNGDVVIKERTSRAEVLPHIIADLEAARGLKPQLEVAGEFTAEDVEVLYREALLLNGDWESVAALDASDGIQAFIKKIADWKLQNTDDITEDSLMEEYMTTWYDTYMRGNLYLNILNYSATYFNMESYRALLPLPSWLTMQGIEQNPGYETQEEEQP